MIKTLSKLLLGLVLLFIVAGGILLLSVNKERNKAAIQAAFHSATGYELLVAGDINITLFPSLGLALNDVRLKNAASPLELASTSAVHLQVNLRKLIAGEILIHELSTNDFHLNYFIDNEGKSNWDLPSTESQQSSNEDTVPAIAAQNNQFDSNNANSADSDAIVSVSFERLQIENASIDIQDLSQGSRYSVNNLDLVSNNTNIDGRPFNINVTFNFLNNGMTKPMTMGFNSDVVADINAGSVDLSNINFNLTPMLLQGSLNIRDLNGNLNYQASLASNDFDVFGLMQTLGLKAVDQNQDISRSLLAVSENPQASYQLEFNGDSSAVDISTLSLQLAESQIAAKANVRFASNMAPTNISYEIVSNRIDLTPFIAANEIAETEEIESEHNGETNAVIDSPVTAVSNTEIPTEMLNTFNLMGSIAIESIVANDTVFSDIHIFTNLEDAVLDIEILPMSAYSGSIAGNIRLDGRPAVPAFSTQFTLSQLKVQELTLGNSTLNPVTGNLNAEIDYSASGRNSNDLQESLKGSTSFAITENTVDIGIIKQVFTAISALSPTGGTIEQWPDVVRFAELSGYILLENGLAENQQLKLRMDNFDITGTGGINLKQQNFDYDLRFTILGAPFLQTISVNELYHGVSWPVECGADFDAEVIQYCRPDFAQVREIFTQLGTSAVKNRLNEVISDQLPPETSGGVRGLLRSLLN